jgi:peptidoglycan hydrolase-like protein with peptidoglycan-binding domain
MISLTIGSRGEDVRALQQKLNAKLLPSPALTADGVFGGLTAAATRSGTRVITPRAAAVPDT